VKNRPYTDYRLTKAIKEQSAVKVSDARPTRTNSTSDSLPSLANDGHKWTAWTPGLENGSVWWELDMENFYDVERVELNFKPPADLDVSIETSSNQKKWKQVAKGEYVTGSVPVLSFEVTDSSKVRFLRVNITAKDDTLPLGVGEIEVFGSTN